MTTKRSLLVFNLLYDCNNHCIFCCADTHHIKKLIPELNFEKFAEKFHEYANHPPNVIQLAGGEPLTYSRINDVFELIKEAKATCCLRTNGRLFSNYNFALSLLKDIKLKIIIPILAANQKDFQILSGNKNSYNETLQAIDNIYDIKTKLNPELKIEITIYLCKTGINQNKEIIRMIKNRWPMINSIDLCLIRIASQVCLKNEALLRINSDELYNVINQTFEAIVEHQFEGDISLNGVPLCFISKNYFKIVSNSINNSEYSEVPEMLFFDGRFNQVEETPAIEDDPITCCADITTNDCIEMDAKFIDICERCSYNSVCNFRINAGNIPTNNRVKNKILAFASV